MNYLACSNPDRWCGFHITISETFFEKLREQRRRVANYKIEKEEWESDRDFSKAQKRAKKECEKLIKMHNFIIGHFEGKHWETVPPKELKPYFELAFTPIYLLDTDPLFDIENVVWWNSERHIFEEEAKNE